MRVQIMYIQTSYNFKWNIASCLSDYKILQKQTNDIWWFACVNTAQYISDFVLKLFVPINTAQYISELC